MIDEDYMTKVQSKQTLKKCRDFINNLFISSGGDRMKFVERTVITLEKNFHYYKDIHYIAEQSFSLKYESMVNSMNYKLAESEWKNHELMRYFKPECVIQVGQRLDSLPDLEKLNGEKKIRWYALEEGKVCLIYIWTTYKSICKKQLTFLNDLYLKYNWEGSVKFISINTDHNREYAQKLIKILNLHKLENLYVDSVKHPNHPLFNVVNKYGYPVCIFVNNDNLIDFCGSLFEIDLEKKIKGMLERNLVSSTSYFPQNGLSEVEKKVLENILKNFETNVELSRPLLKAPHLCGGSFRIKKIYTAIGDTQGKIPQISCDLDYFCHPDDEHIFTDNLFCGIDQIRKIIINKNYVNTIDIPYPIVNTLCSMCQNVFLDENCPQFYCSPCKAYFCVSCGESLTDINYLDKIHNHFLYYIHPGTSHFMKYILAYNSENSYDFDFKYFLDNCKTDKFVYDVKYHFQVKCDGCLSFPIKCVRWKCCNCIFKNLCDNCRTNIENKDPNCYEDIMHNFEVNGCDPNQHVFQKIIFDSFVY